jgi:hypothetical protein
MRARKKRETEPITVPKNPQNRENIPHPKAMEEQTKKDAKELIPKMEGAARGFLVRHWMIDPAREREAPARKQIKILGSLNSTKRGQVSSLKGKGWKKRASPPKAAAKIKNRIGHFFITSV